MNKQRYSNADIIAALKATDGMVYLAADRLGCDVMTIYKRRDKVPAVRETIENARGRFVDTAETALKRAVLAGEGWAVCFALKCQGKDRGYVEKVQQEHTGKDGGPIRFSSIDLSRLSMDELDEYERALDTMEALARRGRDIATPGRDPVSEGPPLPQDSRTVPH